MFGRKRFGRFVENARSSLNVTLEQVAKRSGISKGYLSGIENGKVNPPTEALARRLARTLKLKEEALAAAAELEKLPKVAQDAIPGFDETVERQYVFALGSKREPAIADKAAGA